MSIENLRRVLALSEQLSENLMSSVLCIEELRNAIRSMLDDYQNRQHAHLSANGAPRLVSTDHRPILDESTKRVLWKDRSVHLGHTLYYQVLQRLARRPDQYVTHLDLMREVWENEELKTTTIRSVVRKLRGKLREGGMGELADAIHGHNGRYMLRLRPMD